MLQRVPSPLLGVVSAATGACTCLRCCGVIVRGPNRIPPPEFVAVGADDPPKTFILTEVGGERGGGDGTIYLLLLGYTGRRLVVDPWGPAVSRQPRS